MPIKTSVMTAVATLVVALVPGMSPASAAGSAQPGDLDRYVNLETTDENSPPRDFKKVEPDVVTDVGGGTRIEIYTSVGNSEGNMDWRTVNVFSYLVNSVPKGKHSYTTLFNSLYDGRSVGYSAAQDRWTVGTPSETFAPTAAYLNQANKYSNAADPDAAEDERRKFIHVLGAKESIDEAYAADSSLARLIRAGFNSSRPKAVDYQECGGAGACVTFTGSGNLMHSKYGAFEQAADSTGTIRDDVIFMTSSNLNGSSGSKKTNTSIVVYGDKSAYDAVKYDIYGTQVDIANGKMTVSEAVNAARNQKSVWQPGDSTAKDAATYKDAMAVGPSGVAAGIPTDSGVTLYPSPRGNSSATVTNMDAEARFLLDQVAAGPSVKGDSCKAYASHSLFNSTRSGVFEGFAKLAEQECDVRIVLGNNAIRDIVDGYFTMSTDLRQVIDRVEFANVHDKAFTFAYNGTTTTFGGSSNFTGTSLEYDELAFRADNAAVTGAVQNHFKYIYDLAKGAVAWTKPTKATVYPASTSSKRVPVKTNQTVQMSTRVAPANALVTDIEWSSSNALVAAVSPSGVVRGLASGDAEITATVTSPNGVVVTGTGYISVSPDNTTAAGTGPRAMTPPVLTMERYQGPANSSSESGTTDIVVTWGEGARDYEGVVKLQYYSRGWKTYPKYIQTNSKGVGRVSLAFGSSKTWRAYGARLDGIYKDGSRVSGGSTEKTKSGWSIVTVRSKTSTSTPRLYATSLAKSGQMVPFLLSWNRPGGIVRLQMRSARGSWKTHSSYRINGSQELIAIPIGNTKYWRIATSTGSTKVSNTIKVVMR